MARRKSSDPADTTVDTTVLEAFRESVGDSAEHCTDVQTRAHLNYRYLDNKLWRDEDAARLAERDYPEVYVNRLLHYLGAISGREIMSRYRPKVIGRGQHRRLAGEQLDSLVRWQRQVADQATVDSLVFYHALVCGYGVSHTYPLYSLEQPTIVTEWRPIWEATWDRYAIQPNLVDRQWGAIVKWVPMHELERRYGQLPGVLELVAKSRRLGQSSPSAITMTWSWSDIREGRWFRHGIKEGLFAEYEWRDDERVLYVTTPVLVEDLEAVQGGALSGITLATGATIDQAFLEEFLAQGSSLDELASALQNTPRRVEVETSVNDFIGATNRIVWSHEYSQRERVRYALIAGDQVIYQGERPAFQIQFLTGYHVHSTRGSSCRGLVDFARGVQDVVTKMISAGVHMLGTAPRSPVIAEESAVDDKDTFVNELNSARLIAWIKDGASGKVSWGQRTNFPNFGPWLNMSEEWVRAAFGLTSADIGDVPDPRRVSGSAFSQIKSASSATLSQLFDHLRRYRRDHCDLILKLMPEHFTLAELSEALENDGERPLPPLHEWPRLRHFDIVVDEVPVSPTELMETFQMLTETRMLDTFIQLGIITEEWLIRRFPTFSEGDRRELMAKLEERRSAEAAA